MTPADQQDRQRERVSLTVNGQAWEGWLQCEISLSLEALSATFSVPVTLVPGFPPPINRQDEVQVRIGETLMITGYVLAAEPFYNRQDCGLRVMGHDRTGDLVRCSAIHAGGQWRGASLRRIARDLVQPFGIEVVVDEAVAAKADEAIADFKLTQSETVLDALSRAARLKAVLMSRDHLGRLLLTRAGAQRFPGVIQRGVNVIAMEGIGSDEQRHSHYIVHGQAAVALKHFQLPGDPPRAAQPYEEARDVSITARDRDLQRYLPLVIGADGNRTARELTDLAEHTAAVRRGHAFGFKYLVEGWTWEGTPWALNQRVQVIDDVAGTAGREWLIASVRHTCTLRDGPVTELVVRPIEAYDIHAGLKTRAKHRNYGNKGNTKSHAKGPQDGH